MKSSLFAAAVLALACSTSANAAAIVGLYNTGVASGGVGSGVGGGKTAGTDTHWDLNGVDAVAGNNAPFGWIANGASTASRWISATSNLSALRSPGVYSYTTTFDLTGFDASTASFSGRFAADDFATQILLNGNMIGGLSGNLLTWTNFSAGSSAFVSGVNTLEFRIANLFPIINLPTPSGLRVEFQRSDVSVAVAAVPEPATWAMLVFGFGLVGAQVRRRKPSVRVAFS